jgi:hypothetical protein
MEYGIQLLPKAEIEFLKAFKWYEEQLPGLGGRFETSLEGKLMRISRNPFLYPNKSKDLHECKIDDFQYLVIFKIYPKSNIIFIYSIFHTSRRPGKKYRSNL